MPHIVIEHSANVAQAYDIDALVLAVHQAALDHGLAARDALRTRASCARHYCVADGDPANAFVAIAVRVGPGRDQEQKASFIAAILDAGEANLRSQAQPSPELAIAWSIELNEINPQTRINRNHVRTRMQARPSQPD